MDKYLELVKDNGLALETVPVDKRTREVCTTAIINDSRAFKYVPEEYITAEYVVDVAKKSSASIISWLPKQFKNTSFYLEVVELCPEMIWALPQNSLSAKISKSAIKALGYNTTAEAVKANPRLLSRMHASLYDHESCRACAIIYKNQYDMRRCLCQKQSRNMKLKSYTSTGLMIWATIMSNSRTTTMYVRILESSSVS